LRQPPSDLAQVRFDDLADVDRRLATGEALRKPTANSPRKLMLLFLAEQDTEAQVAEHRIRFEGGSFPF
jgi:hypothetical protein